MTTKDGEKRKLRTGELGSALIKTTNLGAFFKRHEDSFIDGDFAAYINNLAKQKGMVREHVIKRADIDRSYGHQLFEGRRKPSRDKVLQLAFGLELDEDETQKLLKIAGYSELYPRMRRDAVILFAINKGFDLIATQELLDREGFTLIGKV